MSDETRVVLLKATIQYQAEVPIDHNDEYIERHYDEIGTCANDFLIKIQEYLNKNNCCLCGCLKIEVVKPLKDIEELIDLIHKDGKDLI